MTLIHRLELKFSSAHFYTQNLWSEEENQKEFGLCHTPYGHGHNYLWQVDLQSSISEKNDFPTRAQAQLKKIAEKLDHQHLNFAVSEFREKIPTTENIADFLWREVQKTELASSVLEFSLFETEDLWIRIKAQSQN